MIVRSVPTFQNVANLGAELVLCCSYRINQECVVKKCQILSTFILFLNGQFSSSVSTMQTNSLLREVIISSEKNIFEAIK